jgi:SdiA-regulated
MAVLGTTAAAALRAAPRQSLRWGACAGGLLAALAGGGGEAHAAPVSSSLVNTIKTSRWSPANPDPSGLAYDARANRLLVVDGEVEEMSIFSDANYFEATLAGELVRTASTTGFTHEPVGVAFDPGGRIFICDDDQNQVFEIPLGPNGRFDSTDPRSSFSTTAFGSADPEGVTYDRIGNRLFVADGSGSEIYEISPVDGVFGNDNDQVRHFDTKALGVANPETVEFNPVSGTLYMLGVSGNKIVEVTTSGAPVWATDTSHVPIERLGGLAYAPSSTDATQRSFYIADRKLDNDGYPDENDGRIYEVTRGLTVAGRSGRDLGQALADGIRLKARCSIACRVTARLYLRHRPARSPKSARSKPITVAKGSARLHRAGSKRFRIKFIPHAKRRLKRVRKLKLSLHATLTAAGGKAKTRENSLLVLSRR